MPLVSLNEVLPGAKKGKYAIPAFNVVSFEMIIAAIEAAEALQIPIIIEYTEDDGKRIPLEYIGHFASTLAKDASVPICVHLDHGRTFSGIVKAIKSGYSSVMFDGSALAFEDNIEQTKHVVNIAHALGVSVEAELGTIESGEQHYTDVKLVDTFTRKTGVDALAISIGTEHGVYSHKPEIDVNRIEEIATVTKTPLVMHGGSGLDPAIYPRVIQAGISKINYYSAMSNKVLTQIMKDLKEKQKQENIYLQDFIDLELAYFTNEMKAVIQQFRP